MLDAVRGGRSRNALGRGTVDPVVGRVGNVVANVGDAGEMDHGVHARQQ